MTTRMSAAEYREMVAAAGGNPRRVKLPDGSHRWPTSALGIALDDPKLLDPVVNLDCWCSPTARAVESEQGEIILVVSAEDSDTLPGATQTDGRWQILTIWTPEQARKLAAQLLAAARNR